MKYFSVLYQAGLATSGWPRGSMTPFFLCSKNKKGNKGKREKVSKLKLLKGFLQDQNVTVLVMFTVLF